MSNASDLHTRMAAAGWPPLVGLNNKKTTSHRWFSLDGSTVDSYFTPKAGFYMYDRQLKIIAHGDTADRATIAMVLARENASPRVHGGQARGPDGRLPVSVRPESPMKGRRRPDRNKPKNAI